jgi:DNA transformation protein and related proteins
MKPSSRKLTGAKNIGPRIERRLNEIGIFSLDDLEKLGPAVAYQKICEHHPDKTFPVCYYLYSLQGALLNIHWDDLPTNLKTKLLKEIGR